MKNTINKLLFTAVIGLSAQAPALAEQHALLIGVANYQNDRIPDLEGPVHDVTALKSVLQNNWDISSDNIYTLIDEQATERNIKSHIQSLVKKSNPGDDIMIYFSGHGTSVKDAEFGAMLNLPDTSGALVAYDFDPNAHVDRMNSNPTVGAENDGLLIGRYETKPLLQKLSEDRTVFVIFDSCFSGNAVRSLKNLHTPKTKRLLNLNLGTESAPKVQRGISGASRCINCETPSDGSFDYGNVIYFGAAADNQLAIEHSQAEIDAGQASTIDGKPHGGFSDALLRVLTSTNQPAGSTINYRQLFNLLVSKFDEHCRHCGHHPVLMPVQESRALLKPVLSKTILASNKTTASNKVTAELTELDSDLRVTVTNLGTSVTKALKLLDTVELNNRRPEITLDKSEKNIEARSADGLLITTFAANTATEVLSEWLDAQSWLKQRLATDAKQSNGSIRAYFRNPLINPVAFEGEEIQFTVSLEEDARLVMMVTNSLGKVSLLYPTNRAESEQVYPATTTLQFPDKKTGPIKVVAPWGTDDVTIYALPANSRLGTNLIPLTFKNEKSFSHTEPLLTRFTSELDSGKTRYSASHVRIHATQQ